MFAYVGRLPDSELARLAANADGVRVEVDKNFKPDPATYKHPSWYYRVNVDYDSYGEEVAALCGIMAQNPLRQAAAALFMRHHYGMFSTCPVELTRWLLDATHHSVQTDGVLQDYSGQVAEALGNEVHLPSSSFFLRDVEAMLRGFLTGAQGQDAKDMFILKGALFSSACMLLEKELKKPRGGATAADHMKTALETTLGAQCKQYGTWSGRKLNTLTFVYPNGQPLMPPAAQETFLQDVLKVTPHRLDRTGVPMCSVYEGLREKVVLPQEGTSVANEELKLGKREFKCFLAKGNWGPLLGCMVLACVVCDKFEAIWDAMSDEEKMEYGWSRSADGDEEGGKIKFPYQRTQYRTLNEHLNMHPRWAHEILTTAGLDWIDLFKHLEIPHMGCMTALHPNKGAASKRMAQELGTNDGRTGKKARTTTGRRASDLFRQALGGGGGSAGGSAAGAQLGGATRGFEYLSSFLPAGMRESALAKWRVAFPEMDPDLLEL